VKPSRHWAYSRVKIEWYCLSFIIRIIIVVCRPTHCPALWVNNVQYRIPMLEVLIGLIDLVHGADVSFSFTRSLNSTFLVFMALRV
jgi:hypothetical protein